MGQNSLEAQYIIQNDLRQLDDKLEKGLWDLFRYIYQKWNKDGREMTMLSSFRIFISNRILQDYNYLTDYLNAVTLFEEMQRDHLLSEIEVFEMLLTDPGANISPPFTRMARSRQRVANEFIQFFLSAGGFKSFDEDAGRPNYPGYIAGTIAGEQTPYITAEQQLPISKKHK